LYLCGCFIAEIIPLHVIHIGIAAHHGRQVVDSCHHPLSLSNGAGPLSRLPAASQAYMHAVAHGTHPAAAAHCLATAHVPAPALEIVLARSTLCTGAIAGVWVE